MVYLSYVVEGERGRLNLKCTQTTVEMESRFPLIYIHCQFRLTYLRGGLNLFFMQHDGLPFSPNQTIP
ncbi:MAG: hypothetical protein CME25_01060 [Gemmatimonadetes bacterium]|nr:hypothetical protein [Gemmatimonadota bacterium]